ncbi:MAG: phosphoglycerate dehydrogenase [Candidatus Marinimicrobia bacterium]|nr:phosphoglycerate dehydrogenase [Candidatus Neomarinimicrobiota bacterium]
MKVLVTDPISDGGKAILSEAKIQLVDLADGSSSEIEEVLPEVAGWIIRSGTTVTADNLDRASNLKVIGRAGVGIDNIDLNAATLNGVVVMNTPAANTFSAAEHTIALILSLARNVHKGYSSLSQGKWERQKLVGTELKGKTLGVVGLGKIGSEVIRRLHAFGMKIVGYDPFIKADNYELDYVEFLDIDELSKVSDIITLHVPKTDSTADLFNMARFKTMKSSAMIVNCARGGVIDEADLKVALDKEMIAGAAVDVFENEPPQKSPLIDAKNILFTPHLGASTYEAKEGVSRMICEQVRDFLLDGSIANAINIPISDISLLQTMRPFISLAEKLGLMHQQLATSPADRIVVETHGALQDTRLITLAFLKGFLEMMHGSGVNFVNASAVAESHGIDVQEIYGHGSGDYSNIISTEVFANDHSLKIKGSLFSEKHARITYFDGFHLDTNPEGNLLIVYNNDVPGVIGKVGTFLGRKRVNIANYQLGRKSKSRLAMGIIRLDEPLDDTSIKQLEQIEEIIKVQQINLQ